MCGRFTKHHDGEEIRTHFFLSPEYAKHLELRARYNIAPGQQVAVITDANPKMLTAMRWGLIPSWAKDEKIGYKAINARGETVPEKPMFRTAFKKRRCIILVSGWYEWMTKNVTVKTPMYYHRKDGKPIAFAGLWEEWKSPKSELVLSCTIITVAAVPGFAEIHDRMPLVLGNIDEWLSPVTDVQRLRALMTVPEADGIEVYPVRHQLVNKPTLDIPDCIVRA